MNEKEFIAYVESFNKKAGEYTRDEAFQIGLKFKELPVKPMTWKELAIKLGYMNGEALRGLVKNRLTKDGLIEKEPDLVDKVQEQIINNEISDSDDVINEIESKLAILYKEQQKYRDIMTAYRRAMREEARLEVLKDCINGSIIKLDDLPKFKYENTFKTNNNNEAVLLLSDLHIGVECDNFYNQYNVDVARERLEILTQSTIEYCKRNNVKRLTILNLGDLVHGIIHTSARLETEMDVIDQVMKASELLANTLNSLQLCAPEVIYRSCSDNHSRVIANKNEAIEQENFYRLIDWYLQERLKGTKIKFIFDNIDISIGKFTLMNGKTMMFAHGHNVNINTAYQIMTGATKQFIDYICLAHYHSEKVKNFQGARVVVNGSIVGTEQYALSRGLFSAPTQLLMIFEGNNLNSISIDLSTERK